MAVELLGQLLGDHSLHHHQVRTPHQFFCLEELNLLHILVPGIHSINPVHLVRLAVANEVPLDVGALLDNNRVDSLLTQLLESKNTGKS